MSRKNAGDSVKANGKVQTGKKFIDSIDPDDPAYIRELQRPAEIKEDVRQMVDHRRVKQILQSRAFREELDDIINEQFSTGPNATHLQALQQISDLLVPQGRSLGTINLGPVIPVADIRGVDSLNYPKEEKVLRCKLATLYRLLELFGWANGFQCSVSARVNEQFLVAPYGLLFNEVTASSLVKVNLQGRVLDSGLTTLGINQLDFQLHAAFYSARPDINCIIHLRNPIAVAVSVMSCGLLPLCPEAMELGDVSIGNYPGFLDDKNDTSALTNALGPENKVLVLKNFGIVVCGQSVEEAFQNADNVVTACDAQLRTLPVGLENISQPSEAVRRSVFEASNAAENRRSRGKGVMEFEALMRHLDSLGYRTGHSYVDSSHEAKRQRAASDMEISSSSLIIDGDGRSPHKLPSLKKHMLDWSQSPNVYHKNEDDVKLGGKWVSEASSKTQLKSKEHNANTFAPLGPNHNELKEKYKQIRQEYYGEKKSAGPQSRLLEGVSWDEAKAMREGGADVRVHAASKGIIQRDHQSKALVVNPLNTANPFDSITDVEIEKYKKDVERQNRSQSEEPRVTPAPPVVAVQSPPSPVSAKPATPLSPIPKLDLDDTQQPAALLEETSTVHSQPLARTQSAKYKPSSTEDSEISEGGSQLSRSKSERYPHLSSTGPASPTKSTSSAEATTTHDERSSREGSPTRGVGLEEEGRKSDRKKKKFNMPSFGKKDKK